jgi:hypothetical protein
MKKIGETVYASNFPECIHAKVSLLNGDESSDVFSRLIGTSGRSFFNLPDGNWIISSVAENIGDWIKAYNDDINESVTQLLQNEIKWNNESIVYFIAKREIAMQCQ